MLKTKYLIGYIMTTSVLLSCSKTISYDIQGETDVKFFANITSSGNAPQNSISYSVVNIPNGSGTGLLNLSSTLPNVIQFPVFATKPVSADVTVSAVLDTTLIAAYNTAHNTTYASFPAGILNATGLIAHMSKGTTTSVDSITITTTPANLNAMTGIAYMAPIKLTTISDPTAGDLTSNSTTQIVYIVVNVEQRRIKYLALATDAIGALLTSRTTWAATFNPALATVGSIFDGSTTTFSRWTTPITPYGQLDINLQATQNVTGVRLYTSNSATSIPTEVDLYLSNDGINFDRIGTPLRANLTYASSYNYILFYKAIPAKYIRLLLYYSTSTSTNNGRVTEFDVYAN